MSGGFDRRNRGTSGGGRSTQVAAGTPGKTTLVQAAMPRTTHDLVAVPVQLRAAEHEQPGTDRRGGGADGIQQTAAMGVADGGRALPHRETIQRLFGRHDVGGIKAHVGGPAETASRAIGAEAYATGNHVAFAGAPNLHTTAHEAAHVIQQRGGVQLKGGVGESGDAYERHADTVADAVVAGRSAEALLDGGISAGGTTDAIQRKDSAADAKVLDNQASLKGTDVEIPVLEGALLSTRQEAVKRGLLSQSSFDAGLALSQAMTKIQPAVAARGAVDNGLQDQAAAAAQQLFASLQRETANDKNFQITPTIDPTGSSTSLTSQNPYTVLAVA